jgi:PAS domain S-box-containing protein
LATKRRPQEALNEGSGVMGNALEVPENLAIRQGAGLFEAAVDASTEGLALAEQGLICYANPAFVRLLGLSEPSHVIGHPLASLRPVGYPCLRMPGQEGNCENSHLCQFTAERNGKIFRIESTCSPFLVQDREMLFVTIRDVSLRERRRMVRDEDRRFRTIFDGAPTGIVQCDLTGRVLEANPAAERMLGYSRTELRGMHFRQFTHPDDVEKGLELFQRLAQGQFESYEREIRYLGKSSATRWVRLTMSLVRGVNRQPHFVIGMAEDITERKLAEQRLREAQKMEVIGRLVSGVAHLQQPAYRHHAVLRPATGRARCQEPAPSPCRGDSSRRRTRGCADPATPGDFPQTGGCAQGAVAERHHRRHARFAGALDWREVPDQRQAETKSRLRQD